MTERLMTCVASGCRCMNSPVARPCLRCTHEVETSHFASAEFVCARSLGDEIFCGSCGEEVASSAVRNTARHDALAAHIRTEHPELGGRPRFRERTISGARFLFFA